MNVPAREVRRATPRTRIIVADVPAAFTFHAGQAVFAGLAESPVRRPYSIACSPAQARRAGAIELLVQIDDHAAPDPHLERAVPGTHLRIEGPFGSFGLPAEMTERRLLFVAGGTGIAPLRAMIWDALDGEADAAITLLYSARAPEEFAYADELLTLATEGRLRLISTVTRDSGAGWSGASGRIDQALIASVLDDVDTRCVICGPSGLVSNVTTLLMEAGVGADRILTERYGA